MDLSIFEQDELLALARDDMKKQDYTSALTKVKFIFTQERIPLDVLALAGKIYATLGLFDRAKAAFTDYTKNSPDAFVELFQLGMVEKDMGNREQAVKIWEGVLEIQPDYSEVLFYLGELCIQLERIEDARNWLLRLLETAPDDSEFIPLADQLLNRIKAH